MRILRTIVAGSKEPENKEVLWANLKDKKLKVFNNAAWENLGGQDITELDGSIINKGTIPEDALVQDIQDKLSLLPGEVNNIPNSVVRRNSSGEIKATTIDTIDYSSEILVNKKYVANNFLLSKAISLILGEHDTLLQEGVIDPIFFQERTNLRASDFINLLGQILSGTSVGGEKYPIMGTFMETDGALRGDSPRTYIILSSEINKEEPRINFTVADPYGITYKFSVFTNVSDGSNAPFIVTSKTGLTRIVNLSWLSEDELNSLQLDFYNRQGTALLDTVFTWEDESTGIYLTASDIQPVLDSDKNWTAVNFFAYYIYAGNIRRFSITLAGGALTTNIKNYPLYKEIIFNVEASKEDTLTLLKTYYNNPSHYIPKLQFRDFIITGVRIDARSINASFAEMGYAVEIHWDSTNNWQVIQTAIPENTVLYTTQSLTDAQKEVARTNIGALADSSAIVTTDHIADKAVTLEKLDQQVLNLVAKVPLKQDILSATNKLDGSFINFKNNTIPYYALSTSVQEALSPPVRISSDLDILETVKTYTADEFSSAFTYYEDFFTDAVAGARIISTEQASQGKTALVVSTFHNSVVLDGNTTTNDFVYIITATGKFRTITQTYKSADGPTTITVAAWTPWADQ